MKVTITYTLNDRPEMHLEDVLNWPDLSTLEEVAPHAAVYLDQKWGQGTYHIIGIDEAKS